jgi:hypothetical protein
VSVSFPLETSIDVNSVTSPLPSSFDFSETQARSEWFLVWIDELSFKDSSGDKKSQLSSLSSNGTVKCYKNTEKFLRAFDRKLFVSDQPGTSRPPEYIVLLTEDNFESFKNAIPNGDVVGAAVVLCEPADLRRLEFSHDAKLPTLFADTWDRAIGIIQSITKEDFYIPYPPK